MIDAMSVVILDIMLKIVPGTDVVPMAADEGMHALSIFAKKYP